jgi:hypothetical protein
LLLGVLAVLAVPLAIWVRRSLSERLNAIPAQGGQRMTVAALATPHYLQTDPRWQGETIGGTGERLRRVGCTLCSLAMALHHYGIQTTPKDLNDFLKQNDGYTLRGWLKWNSVSNFTGGSVEMDYIGPPSFVRIDNALKNHQPVIAKVYINGIIPHWVLIVGKEQTDYLMCDPLGDGKTVRLLSDYGSRIHAIRTLRHARVSGPLPRAARN